MLGLAAVVLLCTLIVRSKQVGEQLQEDAKTIAFHSNNWVQANTVLQDQKQANLNLEAQLQSARVEVTNLTTSVTEKEAQLTETKTALEQAQTEVAQRNTRIADLEAQNQSLEQQSAELSASLTNLNTQIAELQARTAAAEGDKTAMENELKRLLAEKAELEHKFNDLSTVKAQVKKLRSEWYTAKRLEWMRLGIQTSEPKGAEKMTGAYSADKSGHYFLNVEIYPDGTTRIIPPNADKSASHAPTAPGTAEPPNEPK